MELTIYYEDNSLVVLDKPAGVSSEEPGVPALLRARWGDPAAFVGVVHRLDVGVSGVMVYARTPAAAASLSRQITQTQEAYALRDGRTSASDAPKKGRAPAVQFVKEYRAVLGGQPDEALPPQGTLHDYLFKDSRRGKVFAVDRPRKGVREAVLEYAVQGTALLPGGAESVSLAHIILHTGRTHQIRAQFSARRHPLCGDGKYGSRIKGAIALQSARLTFLHPVTGKRMSFSAPMPQGGVWAAFAAARLAPLKQPASGEPQYDLRRSPLP